MEDRIEATMADAVSVEGTEVLPAGSTLLGNMAAVEGSEGQRPGQHHAALHEHRGSWTRRPHMAPLPNVNAGALIGRIGLGGRPFGIGNQVVVPMPEAGILYLTVNDDERSDNAGEFIVVVNGRPR